MRKKDIKTYSIQLLLFIVTVFTTTHAGTNLMGVPVNNFSDFLTGLYFSVPFLGILTVHEFGHYITARLYRAKVTLPYYIPFFTLIGTMGAFIRIKSRLNSKKEIYDIGIAGPLAGFVVAILLLWYGFTHLPPQEHIFTIHPEYEKYGLNYADYVYEGRRDTSSMLLAVGDNLLFKFFKSYVATHPERIPNKYELMHYPYLFAGYLALFFTALNLLPIGQLDGGHILYGLFGYRRQKIISPVIFASFVFFAGLGIFSNPVLTEDFIPFASFDNFMLFSVIYLIFLYMIFSKVSENVFTNLLFASGIFTLQFIQSYLFPSIESFSGWLIFAFIVGRFLGIYHPPALDERPLDLKRKILGWISLIIFIICFTPQPLMVE